MIALGWSFNLLQRGDASLTRIREVTERAPAIADRPHPAPARPFAGEIEFQHVSLCYGEHEVLHDINLRIPAGATVAVVGPTGAGKTALMKNPRILLLDDALSSVDTHTEEEILRRLREVMTQRTSLIISHRISTVRDADFIMVLDGGRIVDQGTHEELIMRGGLYASMYRRQLLSEELDVEA